MLGCRVLAWEPVPVFRSFLKLGLALNNVSHRVHVREAVVSDAPGQTVSMKVHVACGIVRIITSAHTH